MIPTTLTPISTTPADPTIQDGGQNDFESLQWIDQFNQHLLLTVQALHQLHSAFDTKFTGGHPDF